MKDGDVNLSYLEHPQDKALEAYCIVEFFLIANKYSESTFLFSPSDMKTYVCQHLLKKLKFL